MKYKVGNKVRIKSIDWYEKNNVFGEVDCGEMPFVDYMTKFCGKMVTIANVNDGFYDIEEDGTENGWTDEMIEGLAEDEMSLDEAGRITDFEYEGLAYTLPDGYQFVDENGNVINATKIVLEKKKPKYPESYEECCDILNTCQNIPTVPGWKGSKIAKFQELLICRDAYWKIAGDWKPNYTEESYEQGGLLKYVIYYTGTYITKERKCTPSYILAFPTEEMRDAFYENFKELIEKCEELL